MARTHGRIYTRIWEGDFRDLTRSAQGMYEFILSQPDLNQAGLIGLRLRRWAGMARGLTVDQVSADLAELEDARYILVDHDEEEVLVRTFIRNDQVFRQPNVMLAAGNDAREIASPKLRAALLIELDRLPLDELSDEVKGKAERSPRAVVETVIETLRKAFAELPCMPSPTPTEPFAKGSGNPSEIPSARDAGRHNARVSPTPSSFPHQDTPSPATLEPATLDVPTPDGAGESKRTTLDDHFAEFWALYPRKVGRDDGRKAWDRARKRTSIEVILAGVRRMAADPNLPESKYIPHPSTWLTRGGWADDPFPADDSSKPGRSAGRPGVPEGW